MKPPRLAGPPPRFFCSFCGATHHERAHLLLAPGDGAGICDLCVETAQAQIEGFLGPDATLEARRRYVATFGHGPRPMHWEDL